MVGWAGSRVGVPNLEGGRTERKFATSFWPPVGNEGPVSGCLLAHRVSRSVLSPWFVSTGLTGRILDPENLGLLFDLVPSIERAFASFYRFFNTLYKAS